MFDAVFVGKVVSIETVGPEERRGPGTTRRVVLEVLEPLRGVATASAAVFTGQGGGDCGYGFEIGESYLVYARATNSELQVSICSRTRPLAHAGDDLAFARAVPSSPASGGTITGEVRHRDRRARVSSGADESAPVADIPVVVDCSGLTYRTRTDDRGRFEVSGLAPGTCRARPEVSD